MLGNRDEREDETPINESGGVVLSAECSLQESAEAKEDVLMREALREAHAALERDEVPVGCVFVDSNGNIIARGSNRTNESRNGTQHAEVVAISEAIACGVSPSAFRGSQLFVTCEPCIMCAAAVAKMGVRRVVFGCHNDRFGGNGSILSLHASPHTGYEVRSGVLLQEAVDVFQRFYATENRRGKYSSSRCAVSIGKEHKNRCNVI
jgi:tRNA-specific adenosine deaminase 2